MSERIVEQAPNAPGKPELNPVLKFTLELGPLLVFFFANNRAEWIVETFPALNALGGPLFVATGLFMIATLIALAASYVLTKTLPVMPIVSGVFVLFFGALTLWLQDELFIKMKPTIVNGLFAAILLGGLAFGRPLLGYVFDQAFKLDKAGWTKLTFRWGLFFIFLAVLNEAVWRMTSTDFWVAFKVWGTMPLTIGFMLFQVPLLKRHSLEPLFEETS